MRDPAGGEVFALTDTLVIHVTATGGQNGYDEVDLTVWSRTDLTELRVLNVSDFAAFDTSEAEGLPAHLRLELHYGDRPAITLPLDRPAGRVADREIAEVYSGLLEDIPR